MKCEERGPNTSRDRDCLQEESSFMVSKMEYLCWLMSRRPWKSLKVSLVWNPCGKDLSTNVIQYQRYLTWARIASWPPTEQPYCHTVRHSALRIPESSLRNMCNEPPAMQGRLLCSKTAQVVSRKRIGPAGARTHRQTQLRRKQVTEQKNNMCLELLENLSYRSEHGTLHGSAGPCKLTAS